jgi:Protein of unknown function (DUF2946)
VRKLGTWLALLAIALQALWPLVANAKPRAVTLVPLCTVDGVTHYLELPASETPLEKSSKAHHEHCSFCFLGQLSAAPSAPPPGLCGAACAEKAHAADTPRVVERVFISQDARAPPSRAVRNI